jgi:hypothetical protein
LLRLLLYTFIGLSVLGVRELLNEQLGRAKRT